MSQLKRRGFFLGNIAQNKISQNDPKLWKQGFPILLPKTCQKYLSQNSDNIAQTEKLVSAIFDGQDCDNILSKSPYVEKLEPKFQSLGSVFNQENQQEIEVINFDVMDGDEIIAEDLWLKLAWLSFYDDDMSLRFRFSFGIDQYEDVASDPIRQKFSAELTDAIFPESKIITSNDELVKKLQEILGKKEINFVERIIYFNAPNGGAYMHHDLERGHAGVVFAQVSGSTFWLALPKEKLLDEIIDFAQKNPWPKSLNSDMTKELNNLLQNKSLLEKELDSLANDSLIHLINETKEFVQFLINKGHSFKLDPGDVLLLPQENSKICCWHSVFSIGEEIGQALSFAIR